MNALALRWRPRLGLTAASIVSLLVFFWPLLARSENTLPEGGDASLLFVLILAAVLVVVLAEVSQGGIDAKTMAMLGVLAAVGSLIRPLGAGVAGIETVFFLLILGGRVFGPGFGFVLGSVTLFASALLTAGVGPWLPYQMMAASWVGLGAGLLPEARGRWELALLSIYGAVASLGYGLLMNMSSWPFLSAGTETAFVAGAPLSENLGRFLIFSVTTSLGWDLGRVVTTVTALWLFGGMILAALRRGGRRAVFAPEADFPGPGTEKGMSSSQRGS